MDNWKAANTNDQAKLALKKAKRSSENIKNNKATHDRPAIFIEELKDQGQFDRSIKEN